MADSPSELQFEIEKLERKHAENPEGRFFVPLANAYRKMGDVETAEALLRSGVERHPDYLSAHIVLGRCLADRGAVGEAEDEFRFVLSQDPQNLIALRTLGELAVADGRPAEAAEWYRELLAVDPMNEDARQALDALSDAPAPEQESEFRSGAGWWEAAPEEGAPDATGSSAAFAEPEAAAPDESPEGIAPMEVPEVRMGEDAGPLDGIERFEEPGGEPSPTASESEEFAVERFGWDELPGLRADEAAEATGRAELPAEEGETGDRWRLDADELPGLRGEEVREGEGLDAGDGDRWPGAESPASSLPAEREREPEPESAPEAAPSPAALPFTDDVPASSVDEDEEDGARYASAGSSEVVTETIAELYARQGLHERAASVYRELLRRRGGDEALERRLAEIEALARGEEGMDEVAEGEGGLALADDEALPSPALDAPQERGGAGEEDDPFAASFADGFTTVDQDEPFDEATAGSAAAPEREPPREGEDVAWDEHPLPELAPEPATVEAPAAAALAGGALISDLLRGLATWRPTGHAAPAAPPVEAAATAPDGLLTESEEEVAGEEISVPSWEAPTAVEEEAGDDLPYLEQVSEAPAAGGTGSADDEPFPWELPGVAVQEEEQPEEGRPETAPAAELDPFFVDDVEPPRMRSEEPLPEAASPPAPEASRGREPEPPIPAADPSEDEDLESFQAWLRSLKR